MARDHVCPECGQKFDVEVVEAAFNNQYAPKYLYENFEEELCGPCAFLMVERGLIDPTDSFSDEREPDI